MMMMMMMLLLLQKHACLPGLQMGPPHPVFLWPILQTRSSELALHIFIKFKSPTKPWFKRNKLENETKERQFARKSLRPSRGGIINSKTANFVVSLQTILMQIPSHSFRHLLPDSSTSAACSSPLGGVLGPWLPCGPCRTPETAQPSVSVSAFAWASVSFVRESSFFAFFCVEKRTHGGSSSSSSSSSLLLSPSAPVLHRWKK